ncbi:hypothetical protein E0500_025090 [Streptomyces sp. KM273126]|uniref:hypothetical protein n=1 Tax=Streptomyces sp. KM273126 TaxID=2545247 RepID=UPI00103F2A0D|nr:hypothetical protein [Streptomyces sp. KM273126]MBA2810581.1 hypothetical protein [Streptomyces sp. KM273126]
MLTDDLRNHGMSGYCNCGICTIGLTEYRDIIGSLRYAADHPDTKNMKKALLSVCLGANSTAVAWARHSAEFAQIRALILHQPLTGRSVGEQFSKVIGWDGGYDRLDQAVLERTGFRLEEQSP